MSANAVIRTPLYKFPSSYARENGELEQYRESRKANAACKDAIEAAVEEKWNGWNLPDDCARDVLQKFGAERVFYVLANTLQYKEDDERFSHKNRDWAKTVRMVDLPDRRMDCIVESHPAKLEYFITAARKEMEQERKPSIRRQLASKPVQAKQPHKQAKGRDER